MKNKNRARRFMSMRKRFLHMSMNLKELTKVLMKLKRS